MKLDKIILRKYDQTDDIDEITILINVAYKHLSDLGFNYTGSYQDSSETIRRIQSGDCYLAIYEEKIIGTILYFPPESTKGYKSYQKNGLAVFGQFAVLPEFQKSGIGSRLLNLIEKIAIENHVTEIALDTSEGARHLIKYYSNRGYQIKDTIQWEEKTYRSIIMSKQLLA